MDTEEAEAVSLVCSHHFLYGVWVIFHLLFKKVYSNLCILIFYFLTVSAPPPPSFVPFLLHIHYVINKRKPVQASVVKDVCAYVPCPRRFV